MEPKGIFFAPYDDNNTTKKQGQTVHKLQIATFWDIYNIYISY